MIGDVLTDIKAGKEAGCRTILLGRIKCELCRLMDEEDARPHKTLANPYPRTPAMAAGISNRIWAIEDIVRLVDECS